jgi:hypothetical protein
VTAVEPKWLVEVAPQFFKVADANKISKRKRQEKIEPLFNKYEKPDEWRLSKIKRSARSVCFGFFCMLVFVVFNALSCRVKHLVERVRFLSFHLGCTLYFLVAININIAVYQTDI